MNMEMATMITESQHRLEAFEKMLSSVQAQHTNTVKKMERLRAENREKSVTFRQLMANKLQLQNVLSMYKLYGLVDDDAKSNG